MAIVKLKKKYRLIWVEDKSVVLIGSFSGGTTYTTNPLHLETDTKTEVQAKIDELKLVLDEMQTEEWNN